MVELQQPRHAPQKDSKVDVVDEIVVIGMEYGMCAKTVKFCMKNNAHQEFKG